MGRPPPSTGARTSPSKVVLEAAAGVLAAQRDRWLLWLPMGAIAGAAAWLSAPRDPPAFVGLGVFALATIGACAAAYWPAARREGFAATARAALAGLCALAASVGFGAAMAEWRAARVAGPVLAATDGPVVVEGWVMGVDAGERGPRLRILVRAIEGVEEAPRYVRVAIPARGALDAGRPARCLAVLGPPSGPLAPGAYDFARRAYFERLGATGFAYGRCRPAAFDAPASFVDRALLYVAAVRADITATILAGAPGRGGAIAAAMVTGDRSAIDQETNDALRDSGLGHMLSVSGMHMAIVGGLVFAALAGFLSLIAPIALRFPVKKIAAAGALLALGAYLIVSGFSVAALRAYVMAAVAFGAILIDRPAISMRGLALAALIVVALFPESVLEPGFQMSFAATMALVALFETTRRSPAENALPTPGPIIGAMQWSARAIGGVILISIVAGLATDPFALYHFQRFSTYALPANLIAAPIMSFLVAPTAAVAAVLAPFGLADPALQVMAGALDLIAAVGATFGARPEAVRALSQPPDAALILCVIGMCWACLWRGGVRWVGAAFVLAAVLVYVTAPRPVLAIDGELRAVFAREDGAARWSLMRGAGTSTYARERLGGMLGLSPLQVEKLAAPAGCGESACAWRTPGGREAVFVQNEAGFADACVEGAVVIARINAPNGFAERCGLIAVIDADSLAREGGAFVYETRDSVRVTRAAPERVRRAWTLTSSGSEAE